jgi:hypothetical protein
MEDYEKVIEALLAKAEEYGKTSFELAKLKALDKTSDVVSSLVPKLIVSLLIIIGFLFLNVGLAVWIGDLLGNLCFGFFVVAAFYGITGVIMHFFMQKWIKKIVRNGFIYQALN